MQLLDVLSPQPEGQPGRGSSSSLKSLETGEDENEDDEEERKGESLERLQVSEEVVDCLGLQPFEETFGHDRKSSESGALHCVSRNAPVFAVGLAQHDRVVILRYEQPFENFGVLGFDAEAAVAGLHRRVRRENVPQQGFDAVRAGAVQHGTDLAALTVNTMAGGANEGENLPTSPGVSRLVRQRAKLRELCFHPLRFSFGHQWRKIAGALDVRGAVQFPPGIARAVIK